MLNIVIIDGNTLNPGDLSWAPLHDLGSVEVFGQSTPKEGRQRLLNADIVLTNKFVLDRAMIAELPRLKCICVTATGYNIIDVDAASERNILVCNASGYSTPSTAQHTIALLLELSNQCGDYNYSVSQGGWTKASSWTYTRKPTIELAGLSLGIVGFGQIGQKVAEIAKAIGMNVIGYKRSRSLGTVAGTEMVPLDDLYKTADVISLHCPLNEESYKMINSNSLSMMKPSTFIINTARGGLIDEYDLKVALENHSIAGAALDVLQDEPPKLDNPLVETPNCIITPHVAWGSKASRSRLLDITIENVRSFISGQPQNVVS